MKYDLRAVLMHDGLKGRKHVYSYVHYDDAWWKIVDHAVTKVVLETVLDDKYGMHLGAGPFLLIYSRSLPEPLVNEWPDIIKAGARADSLEFLEKFPLAVQEKAYNSSTPDPEQKSTIPHTSPAPTPAEAGLSSLVPNCVPSSGPPS